ncbi:hypothetical protein TDB9533_00215 [Thalassocella blandensis]|nr:hypothetical protein TDB9533_00215 [Thalassocella blandensis]
MRNEKEKTTIKIKTKAKAKKETKKYYCRSNYCEKLKTGDTNNKHRPINTSPVLSQHINANAPPE